MQAIGQMTLRELIIERILFAESEEALREYFMVDPEKLQDLSDLDLFELYEEVIYQSN